LLGSRGAAAGGRGVPKRFPIRNPRKLIGRLKKREYSCQSE
jgi:hypothetical protein